MSTSPGGLGGMRGLVYVGAILENINVMVIPAQRAISSSFSAFNDSGNLKDERQQQSIENLGAQLAELIKKLKA
ncbi:MAG: chromate reductase [Candidatus Omnitrophota bacterium]|jgi:chromate reductase